LNELHKYLYTVENGNKINFENFVNILKCEIPENITSTIMQIFDSLQEGDGKVSVETLKKALRLDNHYRTKLMLKSKETIASEMEIAILFVSGNKGYLDSNDFLEMHRNMYWVQPKENLNNYLNMVKAIWGYK
jgi:Ca2+-binding EF-hand superfamily protein